MRTLVCYLPQTLSAPAARLLRAVADAVETTVIVGLTGNARADAAVLASAGRLGLKVGDDELRAIAPSVGTRVVDASDPDDEVRAVVRGVVDAMRDGVPLERMAICYSSAEPYARLLHEHLDLAGIAHNGASPRSLSECVMGRALLRMLAWPHDGYRRDDLFAWCTATPVLDGRGHPVPAARWERVSRRAGVVRGEAEWSSRLDYLVAELDRRGEPTRDRTAASDLRSFATRLAADLDPARVPASWSKKCRWAQQLIDRYLGNERRRERWPAFEQEAARRVERVLDRCAGLDEVEAAPSLDVFRRTIELELTSARDRVGRLGDGVLVGPVSFTLGTDLDRLFVCGLAEGVFPSVAREDPLLGDRERAVCQGELTLRADRVDDDHRFLLAALASTSGERVLSFGRGDLRRNTERVPSRYLTPTLADHAPHERIASYLEGLTRAPMPASRHEYDLRALLGGATLASRPLQRGLDLMAARRSDAFTRFDGNLSSKVASLSTRAPGAPGVVVSATKLQTWATCPHAYFVKYVLGIDPVERPEEILQLTPIDRGTMVHGVLDRFVREGGTPAQRARLHEIVDEACADVEARGLAGRRLLWERDRRLLHAEMDAWLDADEQSRDEYGLTTLRTEFAFDAVAVPLSDGRVVHFRGAADRIDRAANGNLVVFDYKTGSPAWYAGLGADDPVSAGTHLQLPVYAAAARAEFGEPADATVEAYYWFVGKGDDRWIGYDVDGDVARHFDAALRAIADGIAAGCFTAIPPAPGPRGPFIECEYCDPDGLGTADRWREWERKRNAPELSRFLSPLHAPDDAVDG
jgi:RecB family exonuclease